MTTAGKPVALKLSLDVSGKQPVENVKDAIERGAKGFVVKPFSPKKIAGILKKLLPELAI